jgi:hypothetical protein
MSNQTRRPTGDGDISGWYYYGGGNCYSHVDDPIGSPDADYIRAPTTSANYYALFTFPAFTIPDGSVISKLSITYRHLTYTSNGGSWGKTYIKVNGTRYAVDTGRLFSLNAWAEATYDYTVNPDTGAAWTVDDINGAGSHPLQQFGIYGGSVNHQPLLDQVYATVEFTEGVAPTSTDGIGGGSGGASNGDNTPAEGWGAS